jgi:hypothetical protein
VTPNAILNREFLQTAVLPERRHFLIADTFSPLGLPNAFENSRTMLVRPGKYIGIGIFGDLLHLRALHIFVIASEAKQSSFRWEERMDCFVASLLAMTGK